MDRIFIPHVAIVRIFENKGENKMPMFKGVMCNKAKHLGYRDTDPTRDKDTYGEPVSTYCAAIVRIKDCRIYEKDGRKYYDPKDAPAIPTTHGASWYSYGRTKIRKQRRWFWYEGEQVLVSRYFTTPFYAVKDAIVYQGTIARPEPNVAYYKERGLSYQEAQEKIAEYQIPRVG